MELQQIDVFIEKDGQVRLEVRGLKGKGCLQLTAGLEAALGGKIVAREMTPEAHDQTDGAVDEQQHTRQGRGT